MARPHILFIQAQCLPWMEGLYAAGREGVQCKILSIDDTDADATCIVRYPPGWSRSETEHLLTHEEFFVLDGSLSINGQLYEKHSYAFLPAGYVRKDLHTQAGCALLTMFYGKPETRVGEPAAGLYDKRLLIPYINVLDMEWDPGLVDPQLAPGVAIKPLREDPYTKEVSFLYCSPPHRVPPGMAKPQWTHSMVEELYCIEGEYVWGDCGRMGPGGYAWWREGVYHGPAGTDVGYNLFVRTVNGPLDNHFDTEKKPFTWTPEYNPILPDSLRQYAQPYLRSPNY